MARVPLLDDDERPSKTYSPSSTISWTHRLMAQLAGQDELTFAICKAASAIGAGPKEKYLNYLIATTDSDPNIIEEILLRISALTEWQESRVISCKTLAILHIILQRLDRYYNKQQAMVIFLNELKDRWQNQDSFLEAYTIALLHRILMDNENPSLATSIYGSLSALAVNSASVLRAYPPTDVLLFLTNLISYLERLTSLGRIDMTRLNSQERQVYSYAISITGAECRALLTVTGNILSFLQQLTDFESKASLGPLEGQIDMLKNTWRMGTNGTAGSSKGASWI
eukprot:scaffold2636_cov176-Ochromonas_danica.AAC.3